MGEQVRQLREHLGLSQEKFGAPLGLTRSGISRIEKGETALTPSNRELICLKYSVNREWLETGRGPMFVEKPEQKDEVASIAREYKLRNKDLALIVRLISMPTGQRDAVIDFMESVADAVRGCEEPDALASAAGEVAGNSIPDDLSALLAEVQRQYFLEKTGPEKSGGLPSTG